MIKLIDILSEAFINYKRPPDFYGWSIMSGDNDYVEFADYAADRNNYISCRSLGEAGYILDSTENILIKQIADYFSKETKTKAEYGENFTSIKLTDTEFNELLSIARKRKLDEAFISNPEDKFTEETALEFLSEYVPYPELYKNDYNTWELAMFESYDDLLENPIDYDITLSPKEFNAVHDALADSNYAYFVRNFTTGDEEDSRHEDDIDQSIEYFEETYDVSTRQALAMKFLVDNVLKPSL